MNCISGLTNQLPGKTRYNRAHVALYVMLLAISGVNTATAQEPDEISRYGVDYLVSVDPLTGKADVELRLRQSTSLLREVSMRPNFARLTNFSGDGEIETSEHEIRWFPPKTGGALRWSVRVNHRRNDSGYDAWLGPDWGLFRAEDLIPRARTRTLRGAQSKTQLVFDLPEDWTVATQYFSQDGRFAVDDMDRRYDEPSGWIALGHIGVRRDRIAGVRVAAVGPTGQSVRRLDTLAMLNWTLPELARIVPALPARLTVFSAGGPMWRGGLSAPQSLFVHADRPLISENGTSTLLHEVMHVALGIVAKPGYDWIVEGLAEYYSLELLSRSGTISKDRRLRALQQQAQWAEDAQDLCSHASTGATTALAVTVFSKTDQQLRIMTKDKIDLDDLVRVLAATDVPVDLLILTDIADRLAGEKPDALRMENLPGCRKINADTTQE
jgi:hypothetical protein